MIVFRVNYSECTKSHECMLAILILSISLAMVLTFDHPVASPTTDEALAISNPVACNMAQVHLPLPIVDLFTKANALNRIDLYSH